MGSERFWVLVEESCADRLLEGLVYIVVLPFFRARLAARLETHLTGFSLELVERDWAVAVVAQIALGADQDDWCIGADLADLRLPSNDVFEGGARIDGDTQHEAISPIVADLTVDTEMGITASVMDLQPNRLSFKSPLALEYIEHARLIVLREDLLLVINDQTGLTDGGVAN